MTPPQQQIGKVPECILHIGVPKTGSTSIQASLRNARERLAAQHVLYPIFEPTHLSLVSAFIEDPESFDYNQRNGRSGAEIVEHDQACLAALKAEIARSPYEKVILSVEHMVLLRREGISALKAYLDGIFSRTTVLMYQRDPIKQSISMIQEHVKNGRTRLKDDLANPPFSRPRVLIERWESVYGKEAVKVYPFTGDLPGKPDIVQDFLVKAGLESLSGEIETVRQNESLSGAALLIADAMAGHASMFERGPALKSQLSRIAGPKYVIGEETMARIVAGTEESRKYLKEVHGFEFGEPPMEKALPDNAYFTAETIESLALILSDLKK